MSERINPRDLVPMDVFTSEPIKTDLVYADAKHPENIFNIAAYDVSARMTLHREFARITLLAARLLNDRHGWILVLKDGLRPVEAQQKLIDTDIVRQNPAWLEEPGRLLAPPGKGAHPRGMAIDVSIEGIDMGTMFDEMTAESARDYTGFSAEILANRKKLEAGFMDAASKLGLPVLALPSEWWDFRFPASYNGLYAPLQDGDLPPPLRMCSPPEFDAAWEEHFSGLAKSIPLSL